MEFYKLKQKVGEKIDNDDDYINMFNLTDINSNKGIIV